MGKVENNKQNPEEGTQKSEEGEGNSLSLLSSPDLRQWQTFILAIIIIGAYVVFFAWTMHTAPVTTDKSTQGIVKNTIDYGGMASLTSTFGIIAAAVVGYYFGQRNLEKAANIAQNATDLAKQAKDEVEVKKIDLKNERKNFVKEVDKGVPLYEKLLKVMASPALDKSKKEMPEQEKIEFDSLKKELEDRVDDLKFKSNTKKEQLKVIESSESEKKPI